MGKSGWQNDGGPDDVYVPSLREKMGHWRDYVEWVVARPFACWVRGHDWQPDEDFFGNDFRLCVRCCELERSK